MLELGGNGFINCLQGPAILLFDNMSLACGEKRLNGQNESFGKDTAVFDL